jgi:hypothetical protein
METQTQNNQNASAPETVAAAAAAVVKESPLAARYKTVFGNSKLPREDFEETLGDLGVSHSHVKSDERLSYTGANTLEAKAFANAGMLKFSGKETTPDLEKDALIMMGFDEATSKSKYALNGRRDSDTKKMTVFGGKSPAKACQTVIGILDEVILH